MRGTHIGSAFATFRKQEGQLVCDLRFNINGQITVFDGTVALGDHPSIAIDAKAEPDSKELDRPSGTISIDKLENGVLQGRWELEDGSAGTIDLAQRGATPTPSQDVAALSTPQRPVQIIANEFPIGAATVYRNELEALIGKLRSYFDGKFEPVVTTKIDGRTVIQFANDFLNKPDLPHRVSEIRINISNNKPGIQSSATINLAEEKGSHVVVQSDDPYWVAGAGTELRDFVERFTSKQFHFLKTYGLNFNALIFLISIILLPSLVLIDRIIFFTFVILLLFVFKKVHSLIPNTTVYLDETGRAPLRRQWPAIYSTVAGSIIIIILAWIFEILDSLDVSQMLLKFIQN